MNSPDYEGTRKGIKQKGKIKRIPHNPKGAEKCAQKWVKREKKQNRLRICVLSVIIDMQRFRFLFLRNQKEGF